MINLDDLTELEDSTIFKFDSIPVRPYEKVDRSTVVMAISLERNLDLTVIVREGYTILDLLSDVGGL